MLLLLLVRQSKFFTLTNKANSKYSLVMLSQETNKEMCNLIMIQLIFVEKHQVDLIYHSILRRKCCKKLIKDLKFECINIVSQLKFGICYNDAVPKYKFFQEISKLSKNLISFQRKLTTYHLTLHYHNIFFYRILRLLDIKQASQQELH